MTDEEMKKAAEEYTYWGIPDEMKSYVKPVGDEIIKNFIAGAKWQKEQMLKDAVEGVVFGTVDDHWVETGIDEKLSYVSPGDKVRVIIVKEDKK